MMVMDDDTTNPGGKTQKELDTEYDSELQAVKDELSDARRSNRVLADWTSKLNDELHDLRSVRPQWPRLAAAVMLFILAATIAVTASVHRSIVAHLAELLPPAAGCPPIIECPAATLPVAAPTDDAFYMANGEGGFIRRPWPDASAYPADRFEADCRAVCEVPAGFSRDHAPGRVITMDPAHLTCVCFHADDSWPIERWINWERIVR